MLCSRMSVARIRTERFSVERRYLLAFPSVSLSDDVLRLVRKTRATFWANEKCFLWFRFINDALWLVRKTRATFSANEKRHQNQRCLARSLFPALNAGCMYLFWLAHLAVWVCCDYFGLVLRRSNEPWLFPLDDGRSRWEAASNDTSEAGGKAKKERRATIRGGHGRLYCHNGGEAVRSYQGENDDETSRTERHGKWYCSAFCFDTAHSCYFEHWRKTPILSRKQQFACH